MSVNGITNNTTTAYTAPAASTATKAETTASVKEDPAAVYEKSDNKANSKKVYKQDTGTINKLLADMENRKKQLENLVAKTLRKQGETYNTSMNIYDLLKSGNLKFSPEDIAQAKEDVSEDGYWGVEQTSERIYSFAFALTGGDPSKADEMMAAVEKGFKQATKAWGSDLPDISKQTLEAVREKINNWKNGTTVEE
ncbi:hypothetical protein [Acetivibrio ethanolgignens]|uniref:Uncharacterized protein n=1 Tax=Acetivibrio ethanolgignens TaxID=290052 RepID=A0A0V8QDV1_9FIRM|nr:hypothetical protein [Acetivibrio ethanolgignens]KSV58652.1 hypothetical protein ASU35_02290 [Acetivibrio ethanolgignens]